MRAWPNDAGHAVRQTTVTCTFRSPAGLAVGLGLGSVLWRNCQCAPSLAIATSQTRETVWFPRFPSERELGRPQTYASRVRLSTVRLLKSGCDARAWPPTPPAHQDRPV